MWRVLLHKKLYQKTLGNRIFSLTFQLAHTNISAGVTHDSKHYYYFGCGACRFGRRDSHIPLDKKQRICVRVLSVLRFNERQKKRLLRKHNTKKRPDARNAKQMHTRQAVFFHRYSPSRSKMARTLAIACFSSLVAGVDATAPSSCLSTCWSKICLSTVYSTYT